MKLTYYLEYSIFSGPLLIANVVDSSQWNNSALKAIIGEIKGPATVARFGEDSQGLFFNIEDNGSGLIAMDSTRSSFVVANVVTAEVSNYKSLIPVLEKMNTSHLKSKGTVSLNGEIAIFDANFSAEIISKRNFNSKYFLDSVSDALKVENQVPLLIPDQKIAGGVFMKVVPGVYSFTIMNDVRASKITFDFIWLSRIETSNRT